METLSKDKKRSMTPDVCRGIAIFLVIWGHVLQQGLLGVADVPENPAVKIIYSFHMPLFVLISGYFFYGSQKKKNCKELVFDRSCKMLKVIVIWNTIHYMVTLLLEFWMEKTGTFSFGAWGKAVAEGYWFLWAMLFCTIAVGITVKFISMRFWPVGFLLFIPLALLSPCRWVILSIYPFFVAGFWYHKWEEDGKKVADWLKCATIVIFVITLLCYFSVPAVGNSEWLNMVRSGLDFVRGTVEAKTFAVQVGRLLLYYILGTTGSVSVLVLADMVVRKINKNVLLSFVAGLGQYSLQIYILQRVLVELLAGQCYQKAVDAIGYHPVAEHMVLFTWVYSLLISVVCTVIIYNIIRFLLRGRIGIALFGR